MSRRSITQQDLPKVAANGLIDRRVLLRNSALLAGAAGAGFTGIVRAAAEPLAVDDWSMKIGAGVQTYSTPSRYEAKVIRTLANPTNPGNNQARTPHHLLDGMITPSALHFVVARTGAPDARLQPRRSDALSDGIAHPLRRMRRQLRADVVEGADPSRRTGAARSFV